MKKLTLLIGLPACGKSTWRHNHPDDGVALSTDDIIEEAARLTRKTYDDVFSHIIGPATKSFDSYFRVNMYAESDIIIDRTNLTPKVRNRFIDPARRAGYHIHAVVFDRPYTSLDHQEWNLRLNRPGKTIPNNVLQSMFCSFTPPKLEEGFTTITPINTFHVHEYV